MNRILFNASIAVSCLAGACCVVKADPVLGVILAIGTGEFFVFAVVAAAEKRA